MLTQKYSKSEQFSIDEMLEGQVDEKSVFDSKDADSGNERLKVMHKEQRVTESAMTNLENQGVPMESN